LATAAVFSTSDGNFDRREKSEAVLSARIDKKSEKPSSFFFLHARSSSFLLKITLDWILQDDGRR
jgi:hypothetical protein